MLSSAVFQKTSPRSLGWNTGVPVSLSRVPQLDKPPLPRVVHVNSLLKFDEGDMPYNKHPSRYLYEFDNYIRKQDHFNAKCYEIIEIQL